jgi:NAD(P)-dependent dehydrogenase (short-subunit alcohol dehydrogenase family)
MSSGGKIGTKKPLAKSQTNNHPLSPTNRVAPMLEISDADVERMFSVNFMGVWHCYTKAAKQMISQGPVPSGSTGYKIIGAASIVAFKPFPLLSHYSASKWAVRGLTQVTAMELAKYKIQVNAYAPGIVGTAMWDLIDEKLGEREGRGKGESVKKYSSDLTAMGRVSVPDDVAKVVGGFLAGRDSEFVTGEFFEVFKFLVYCSSSKFWACFRGGWNGMEWSGIKANLCVYNIGQTIVVDGGIIFT